MVKRTFHYEVLPFIEKLCLIIYQNKLFGWSSWQLACSKNYLSIALPYNIVQKCILTNDANYKCDLAKVACVTALDTSMMLSSCWCSVLTPSSRALFLEQQCGNKVKKKITTVQVFVIYFTDLFLFIFSSLFYHHVRCITTGTTFVFPF